MATRCELRWQLPRVPDDAYAAAVRSLYVELTGDSDGAARLPLRVLADALRAEPDDDPIATHRRLAARRAGDSASPSGSVYERYLQLQLDAAERAHAAGLDDGPRFTFTGCDPAHALFRSER